MRKKKIQEPPTEIFTERGIKLKETTKFFTLKEVEQAEKYAHILRSYVGSAFDKSENWIGYYVPL